MPAKRNDLRQSLQRLEAHLRDSDPGVLKALAKGASDGDIEVLSGTVFGGKPVPAALEELFRWHNGQATGAAISPDRVHTLMDARAAAKAWTALNRLKAEGNLHVPWEASWVPIFENGGGDYLVFESGKKGLGSVLSWWHDDERRKVVAKSLAAFADGIVKLRKAVAKGPPKQAIDWNLAAAKPLASISSKDVDAAPVGTTYLGGPLRDQHFVCIRAGEFDQWASGWVKGSQEDALRQIGAIVEANNSMKYYGTHGALAQIEWLLGNPQGRATAKTTLAKIRRAGR